MYKKNCCGNEYQAKICSVKSHWKRKFIAFGRTFKDLLLAHDAFFMFSLLFYVTPSHFFMRFFFSITHSKIFLISLCHDIYKNILYSKPHIKYVRTKFVSQKKYIKSQSNGMFFEYKVYENRISSLDFFLYQRKKKYTYNE